jgi:hypothetical protein
MELAVRRYPSQQSAYPPSHHTDVHSPKAQPNEIIYDAGQPTSRLENENPGKTHSNNQRQLLGEVLQLEHRRDEQNRNGRECLLPRNQQERGTRDRRLHTLSIWMNDTLNLEGEGRWSAQVLQSPHCCPLYAGRPAP